MHTYILSLLGLPPASPIPPLQVVTEHQAELPALWRQLVLKVLLMKKWYSFHKLRPREKVGGLSNADTMAEF